MIENDSCKYKKHGCIYQINVSFFSSTRFFVEFYSLHIKETKEYRDLIVNPIIGDSH